MDLDRQTALCATPNASLREAAGNCGECLGRAKMIKMGWEVGPGREVR